MTLSDDTFLKLALPVCSMKSLASLGASGVQSKCSLVTSSPLGKEARPAFAGGAFSNSLTPVYQQLSKVRAVSLLEDCEAFVRSTIQGYRCVLALRLSSGRPYSAPTQLAKGRLSCAACTETSQAQTRQDDRVLTLIHCFWLIPLIQLCSLST